VVAGEWLATTLAHLRTPEALATTNPRFLQTALRPYQAVGVRWLWFLSRLGLGACLADDMGLGKTIQVLGLLLLLKTGPAARSAGGRGGGDPRPPSLLVVPASLIANWQQEIGRFAPSLEVLVAHPSERPSRELTALAAEDLAGADLVITTYGQVPRLPWLGEIEWTVLVLDEAQAIKNPAAKQARAVKRLRSRARVALTGTPIENRLGICGRCSTSLEPRSSWVAPGLHASPGSWRPVGSALRAAPGAGAALHLRRLKTDRQVITDLRTRPRCARSARLPGSRPPSISRR
jgi:non-specific serine/threonine protein kinase